MSDESKNNLTDIERMRVEGDLKLRQQELEFKRLKWEKEQEYRKENIKKDSSFKITPVSATIVVAIIGLIGAGIGAALQGYANLQLERLKLKSQLILKAIDTPDQSDAAAFLNFLKETKLVEDIDDAVKQYIKDPEKLPLRPQLQGREKTLKLRIDVKSLGEMPPSEFGGSQIGRKALAIAFKELEAGASELTGSNDGPWVEKYLNKLVPTPAPWNAAFISWCFSKAKKKCPLDTLSESKVYLIN